MKCSFLFPVHNEDKAKYHTSQMREMCDPVVAHDAHTQFQYEVADAHTQFQYEVADDEPFCLDGYWQWEDEYLLIWE